MSPQNRFLLILLLTMSFVESSFSATVSVNNAQQLVNKIDLLYDGDTLSIAAGYYVVGPKLAPDGLFVARFDWKPYENVTILGAGRDSTIIDFDGSYGFMPCNSQNVVFKNMMIKNARINGGIYAYQSSISLDSVRIDSCASVSSVTKTEGNGGALYFDEASYFTSISNCIFSNNSAELYGGAIAYLNTANYVSGISPKIEKCQFYNNTSLNSGSALYFPYIQNSFYFRQNVVFNNTGTTAVYVNGRRSAYFKNNSIVLNDGIGLYVSSNLTSRFYFDNNVVANNTGIDCKGRNSSNYYKGWFNVCGTSYNVNYEGSFNDIVSTDRPFYSIKNDSLCVTQYGAGLLTGRVSSSKKMSQDIYGQTWSGVGDVGAIKVPLGDSISVWTGSDDQNFMNASNWKDGLVPSSTSRSTKKIIISNCNSENYPIIDEAVSVAAEGDLSSADLYVCATGVLCNFGDVEIDTLYLESQSGGSSQLLNKGTLMAQARMAEHFLVSNVITPVYFPDYLTPVDEVLFNANFNYGYYAFSFDESDLSRNAMTVGDNFSQNEGYWVQNNTHSTMTFNLPTVYNEAFGLQHTKKDKTALSGWNLIGNPYDASLLTAEVILNTGNSDKVASAFYTFSDGHFKAFVDSIGDEESEVIMPHTAFYVKALDVDSNSPVDNNISFVLDTGDIILEFTEEEAELISKDELMKVSLYESYDVLIDDTYIRFKDAASDEFDSKYDAYKLDYIFNLQTENLFSGNSDDAYAINTLPIAKDGIKSLNLNVDCPSAFITNSKTQKLKFDLSGNELEYLLHDAEKDSSESIIVKDSMELSFLTGTDSASLFNRFSLQIFEDTIPNRIDSVNVYYSKGYVKDTTASMAYVLEKENESHLIRFSENKNNPDTVFITQFWVDSIFVDSISCNVQFSDSIVLDSTFSDTSKVLGAYSYIVHNVTVAKTIYTTLDTLFLDTVPSLEWHNYILFDTVLVTSVIPVREQPQVDIITDNGTLTLKFPDEDNYEVELYNISGSMICRKSFVSQGSIYDVKPGVYILSVRSRQEQLSYKIVVD